MTDVLFIGKTILKMDSIPSTNQYAQSMLESQRVNEGTVVQANYQTGGRGYGTNKWESEAGKNVLISIVLKPSFLQPKKQFFLSQVISLAVAEAVKDTLPRNTVKVKWPNDIFCDDKKIAGILIENSIQGTTILHSVVGIGINVNQKNFSSPIKHATSMSIAADKEISLTKVMDILLKKIEYRYLQLKNNHIEDIQKDYMKNLYRVEESCFYVAAGRRFKAKIVGLTAEGKLVLQVDDHHEVFGFKEVGMVI